MYYEIYTRVHRRSINEPLCYIYYLERIDALKYILHKARHSAVTKSVKHSYEISTKRYHLPVVLIVRRVLRELYYTADYPESFENTGVVTISSLLSALRLCWREATLVIIVFKRTEKFVVKVDGESPPPQALLNYSDFPC